MVMLFKAKFCTALYSINDMYENVISGEEKMEDV